MPRQARSECGLRLADKNFGRQINATQLVSGLRELYSVVHPSPSIDTDRLNPEVTRRRSWALPGLLLARILLCAQRRASQDLDDTPFVALAHAHAVTVGAHHCSPRVLSRQALHLLDRALRSRSISRCADTHLKDGEL